MIIIPERQAWGWQNGWGWSKGTNLLYKVNKSCGYNIHPGDYSYDTVLYIWNLIRE